MKTHAKNGGAASGTQDESRRQLSGEKDWRLLHGVATVDHLERISEMQHELRPGLSVSGAWFHWDEHNSLGPLNPVIGFFVWFGLNWVFGLLSWQAFRNATNRARDTLAATLPRRYDPELDDDEDAEPAPKRVIARPVRKRDEENGEEPIILE